MSKFSAVELKATKGISVSIGTSMYSFQEICQRAKLILVHMTINQNTCTLILHRYQWFYYSSDYCTTVNVN